MKHTKLLIIALLLLSFLLSSCGQSVPALIQPEQELAAHAAPAGTMPASQRLAAGSNGASMWWIEPAEGRTAENDNPVLTLESDRRMVADDGMSPRLTLKKGRNIIRCAVVNGPGLSDFCVRFVDEKGNPVTNFEIKN